jgi:hypothetical protein
MDLNNMAKARLILGDYREIVSMILAKEPTKNTWLNDRLMCSKLYPEDRMDEQTIHIVELSIETDLYNNYSDPVTIGVDEDGLTWTAVEAKFLTVVFNSNKEYYYVTII